MTREKDTPSPEEKRPFQTPKLTVYGTLASLANAKDGNKSDGSGKPSSRSAGGSG